VVLRLIFGWTRRFWVSRRSATAVAGGVVVERTIEFREQLDVAVEVHHMRGRCWVIDGDTIRIRDTNIRIEGIDAPELDQAWGPEAKWALLALCKGQEVTATILRRDLYGRLIATCHLSDGRDLGAEMVRLGLALDWPLFSQGKYRHLEPPGVRRKLRHLDVGQTRYRSRQRRLS